MTSLIIIKSLSCRSPFFIEADDPQKDLVDPAVEGTKNVMRSAAKASGIKRIVLTSSVAGTILQWNHVLIT